MSEGLQPSVLRSILNPVFVKPIFCEQIEEDIYPADSEPPAHCMTDAELTRAIEKLMVPNEKA